MGLMAAALGAIGAGSAVAQDYFGRDTFGQIMTPFSSPPPMPAQGSGGQGPGGDGHGDGHGGGQGDGHDWHFHHRGYPFFVYPYFTDSIQSGTNAIQILPVNTAPFTPTTPPKAGERAPIPPYKPPSVEIAPGGIEIIRGPG